MRDKNNYLCGAPPPVLVALSHSAHFPGGRGKSKKAKAIFFYLISQATLMSEI